jgi:organic radical activating enzyme
MKERPLDDILSQLKTFPNLKYVRLVGSISEPTLHKEFLTLCEKLKEDDIEIEICTNGDTHNDEWWERLGEILDEKDKVYFTICGSNQEMHAHYRKGTDLNRILRHVKAFQRGNKDKKCDYAQCIRFWYNDEDMNSENFKETVSIFNNIYYTETFLLKPKGNYVNSDNIEDFRPPTKKAESYFRIDSISETLWENNLLHTADCMADRYNRIQIDVNGNIYPCYLFLEASNGKEWDMDMSKIRRMDYHVCRFCDSKVKRICDNMNLDYII